MRTPSLRSILSSFAVAVISSLAWASAGCSGVSATTVCQQICDCQGCSQTETQECQAAFEKGEKLAGDKGCGDDFSTYVGCVSDNMKCVKDKVDIGACAVEVKLLNVCAKTSQIALPGGGGACDDYVTAVKACCDKVPDASAKTQCHQAADALKAANPPEDTCQAAVAAFKCPY